MTEQISLVQSPAADRSAIGHPTVPRPRSPWTTLTDLLMPTIQATGHTTRQTIAMQRCLRMLNAVTRLEQRGVPVTGLADLSLPPAETADPFSGQPLCIKKLGEHWVIYSVGPDANDDGGQLAADGQPVRGTDLGLGPVPALPALK